MTPADPVGHDPGPSRFGVVAALVAGVVAVLASGAYAVAGLAAGTGGFLLLAAGLLGRRGWAVTAGAAGLLAGAIAAGASGAPVLPTLVGAGAAVVAGDAADRTLTVGRQLGTDADTRRPEAVGVAGSLAVTGGTVLAVFTLYRVGTGGQPVSALVLLLVAAALLALGLD